MSERKLYKYHNHNLYLWLNPADAWAYTLYCLKVTHQLNEDVTLREYWATVRVKRKALRALGSLMERDLVPATENTDRTKVLQQMT